MFHLTTKMTNDELSNNSQPVIKSEFLYNLPYHTTEWGKFYTSYKEQGQGQLQKALFSNENIINESNNIRENPFGMIKWVQHIFKLTEWDEQEQIYKTPSILLRQTKRGWNDPKWFENIKVLIKTSRQVFIAYRKRCAKEHKEVQEFYKNRKKELEIEQKKGHKLHANEHIVCSICLSKVSRTNLSRHIKTNQKCKQLQTIEEKTDK
jgi:hypothetical protein